MRRRCHNAARCGGNRLRDFRLFYRLLFDEQLFVVQRVAQGQLNGTFLSRFKQDLGMLRRHLEPIF